MRCSWLRRVLLLVCLPCLVAISPALAEQKVSIDVKDTPLQDVCAMLSGASGTTVVSAAEIAGRRVPELSVKEAVLQQVLLRLCHELKLVATWAGDKWVLLDAARLEPKAGQVECTFRVLDAPTEAIDALFAAHQAPTEQFRLPRGVALLLGEFAGEVNKLLASGQLSICNEPHVVTADGQEADVAFLTDRVDAGDLNFGGFRPGGFVSSLWVLPRVQDQDHVNAALAVTASWPNAENMRKVRAQPGEDYSIRISLPQVTMGRGQWLLVRGCDLRDEPQAAGRETVWMFMAAPVLPKQ